MTALRKSPVREKLWLRLNLVGQRFGRLTVVGFAGMDNHRTVWNCVCDCGRQKTLKGIKLKRTLSCGCWRHDAPKKHGLSKSAPEYNVWMSMRGRCRNPNNDCYDRYGGRGIVVCDRWDDFGLFLSDMGKRPTPTHTIERINNDGNYEPSNCKWATRAEQARNRSPKRKTGTGVMS